MNIKKLVALEDSAAHLHHYVQMLMALELEPDGDVYIPPGFSDRKEYQLHLGNMIGGCRMELGQAYNAIDEWQNI